MTEFYTHVAVHSNKILFRGVNSKGERFSEYRDFSPTVFVPSAKKTEYQSLEGKFLQPFTAGDMRSMKDYIEKYSNVSGFEVYGNENWKFQYISDNFKGDVDWSLERMKVAYIDIETECESGFPNVSDPNECVNVITVKYVLGNKKETHTFGVGQFDIPNVECHVFDNEQDMLLAFV